jgi:hypothetical protein
MGVNEGGGEIATRDSQPINTDSKTVHCLLKISARSHIASQHIKRRPLHGKQAGSIQFTPPLPRMVFVYISTRGEEARKETA